MNHYIVGNITVGQSVVFGFIGALALALWIYSFLNFNRVLIVAALVGVILGHAKEAIIFGATAELLYLGLISSAGVVPPNPLGPGIVGTIILLTTTKQGEAPNYGTAIALSMPFAIFVQFLITIIFTINSSMGDVAKKLIERERFTLYRISGHSTAILLFISGFIFGISAGLGFEGLRKVIQSIPEWLQKGLTIGGKMLPAAGFAVVFRLVLKKEYTPFLLVGYVLVVIFQAVGASKPEWGFSLLVLTITATAIALIVYYSGVLQKTNRRNNSEITKGGSDGI